MSALYNLGALAILFIVATEKFGVVSAIGVTAFTWLIMPWSKA
jgi:hypothetical protein